VALVALEADDHADDELWEYVIVENQSSTPQTLGDWRLVQRGTGEVYIFPTVLLHPGEQLVVWSGAGEDDEASGTLFWPTTRGRWVVGDTAELFNPQGQRVSTLEVQETSDEPASGANRFARAVRGANDGVAHVASHRSAVSRAAYGRATLKSRSTPLNQHHPTEKINACVHPTPKARSPLAARTALLLQRLRAKAPTVAIHQAVPPLDADLNRVLLTGRLGSEPDLLSVGDHPVALLSLACQRRTVDVGGAVRLESIWLRLAAWEELAEQCGRQFRAGDRVYVEGVLCNADEGAWSAPFQDALIVLDRIVLLAPSLRPR
jgi:hypothetical protein